MKTKLHNLKVWIAGAAKSGVAAARLLSKNGASVFVSDAAAISEENKAILTALNIPFEENGHSIDRMLGEADLIVLSPTIALNRPLPAAACKAGIPVVSEIECASWFLPAHATVIGITGTNGKSTTTHYLAQLMNRSGKRALACGNYGTPLADAILSPDAIDCFVIELSSYQLESTFSLRPDVSIFLNLQNDHQARYGSLEEYFKAKWRLVLMTKDSGTTVVDAPVLKYAMTQGCALPECHIVASYGALDAGDTFPHSPHTQKLFFFEERLQTKLIRKLPKQSYGDLADRLLFHNLDSGVSHAWVEPHTQDSKKLKAKRWNHCDKNNDLDLSVHHSVLEGKHNQVNIFCASMAALALGVDHAIVSSQWESSSSNYVHLSHRLEEILRGREFLTSNGQSKCVRIINDSKATNVESAIVAVESFPRGIRLLLGGEPKGDSYAAFVQYLGHRISKVYPFGKAAPLIVEQIDSVDYVAEPCAHMSEAAQRALDDCENGDVILLSPACASFDEFQNFEHRGEVFRSWAQNQVHSK